MNPKTLEKNNVPIHALSISNWPYLMQPYPSIPYSNLLYLVQSYPTQLHFIQCNHTHLHYLTLLIPTQSRHTTQSHPTPLSALGPKKRKWHLSDISRHYILIMLIMQKRPRSCKHHRALGGRPCRSGSLKRPCRRQVKQWLTPRPVHICRFSSRAKNSNRTTGGGERVAGRGGTVKIIL